MTKCTASWEPSDVSFQSNKALKIGGDHFTPPPYQTRVNTNTGDDAINVVGPTAVRTACSLEKSSFICTFDSDADVAKQRNERNDAYKNASNQ